MLAGYRVFIVLTVLLLFPTLYDYLYREKKSIRENRLSKVSSRQAGSTQQTKKTDTPRTDEQCYTKENLNKRERIIPPVPVSTEWPLAIPTMKDSIHKYPIPSPFHRTDHHQPTDGFRLLPFPDAANPQEEIRKMEVDAGRFTRTATGTELI